MATEVQFEWIAIQMMYQWRYLLCFSGIQIAIEIQAASANNTLKDFKIKLEEDKEAKKKLVALKCEVEEFALSFPMPGFDDV